MQGTQVQSLVRELDPTCHNSRSSTATQVNIKKKKRKKEKREEWPLLLHLFNTVPEAAARELDKKKGRKEKREGRRKKREKKRQPD